MWEPAAAPFSKRPNRRLVADDCIVVNRSGLRSAQLGAGVGNFIEWYDIGVYGYLTVTMSGVFTKGMDAKLGLLVTLLGFAISFVVRPIGGIVLGLLGDRIGRRKVLFFTMGLMATATTLIGCLPTASTIGLWAIAPLYLLKMAQGFSTGGEYSGAATYVAEFSPDRTRGFWTALLNTGSQLGFAVGAGVVALTSTIATGHWGPNAMAAGGWRIPFLLALPLGLIAVSLRSRIPESPSFQTVMEKIEERESEPVFERQGLRGLIKHYWPQILIGFALIAADGSSSYTVTSYMPTYVQTQLGTSAVQIAVATVFILIVQGLILPFAAKTSDRIGRRPIYMMATIGNLVLLVPAFWIMHIGTVWSLYVALLMVQLPSAFFLALTGAVMAELFPTASRYSCVGLTHNLAISLFGGSTPLISQALVDWTGNPYAPAFYVMAFSAIALVASLKMRESAKRPLLGSVPVVESRQEAEELAQTQDENPLIDTRTMLLRPLPGSTAAGPERTAIT